MTTLPIDDPAYAQLAALDRTGCRPARVSAHRPFRVRDVVRAVAQFSSNPQCQGAIATSLAARFIVTKRAPVPTNIAPDLAQAVHEAERDSLETFRFGVKGRLVGTALSRGEFEPLWVGVRPTDEGTPPAVLDGRARVAWSDSPKLVLQAEMYGQTSRRNDPTVRQKDLRSSSAIVDFGESYINGALGRVDLSFGRSWAAWMGDNAESIALSANGPLIDRLEIGIRWSVAEVRAIIASVNDVTMTAATDSLAAGTPDTRFNRWLYGQVLTIKPSSGFELTFGETLLSSRTTGGFNLAYANPLMATLVTQNDTGLAGTENRDNLVLFGGARGRIGRGLLGGELVVDDIQIDKADREKTADQLAWRLYGSMPLPIGTSTSTRLEYAHINNRTYMRDFYTDVYQQYDAPLGSLLGPGADLLRLSAESWISGDLRVSGSIGRWRQGAVRIYERPSAGPNGKAGEPFPTTTEARPEVQSALLADVGAERMVVRLPIAVKLELAQIKNANNQPAAAALYVRAILSASYAFRYP